jgi:hypothetical protein
MVVFTVLRTGVLLEKAAEANQHTAPVKRGFLMIEGVSEVTSTGYD